MKIFGQDTEFAITAQDIVKADGEHDLEIVNEEIAAAVVESVEDEIKHPGTVYIDLNEELLKSSSDTIVFLTFRRKATTEDIVDYIKKDSTVYDNGWMKDNNVFSVGVQLTEEEKELFYYTANPQAGVMAFKWWKDGCTLGEQGELEFEAEQE